jgi:hypothetical protein
MKTITKFAAVALFAISAASPALATDPEVFTLEERNTFTRQVQQPQVNRAAAHRAMAAATQAPATDRAALTRDERNTLTW